LLNERNVGNSSQFADIADYPCCVYDAKVGQQVNRLQKFIERWPNGKRLGRVAYAFSQANLPSAGAGLDWRLDPDFNAAEEVLADGQLKAVFKLAIDAGCAIVERSVIESERQHRASP